ncbi:Dabb family protein [Paenibacillus sp.]|uniref:Dabb family protein n=1 Tax=Paenibacillus sp. TaxID=58172 RepID=UPI002D5ED990|nr:Dabb family protein [Paenibacillus sp.]HZG57935.1 Dabb family protein [Paenibacillus sp.]
MIDRIILVKFGEQTSEAQLKEIVERFRALRQHLTGAVEVNAGINFSDNNKGYQLVLRVRFENKEALEAYGPNPHHQAVAALIREYGREDSIAANIEI